MDEDNEKILIVIGVVIGGLLLIAIGNSIPDKTDIILENKDTLSELVVAFYQCEDVKCKNEQDIAIKAQNQILDTLQLTQNIRNAFLVFGILVEIGTVIGVVYRFMT